MLSEKNNNQLINSNYLIIGSEQTYLYSSNICKKKYIFYNLIAGNIDIYEASDLNEKKIHINIFILKV